MIGTALCLGFRSTIKHLVTKPEGPFSRENLSEGSRKLRGSELSLSRVRHRGSDLELLKCSDDERLR